MPTLEKLFSPIKIASMELKNRIVMAPMATNWANADGTMSERLTDYFEARAKGGVGLLILEVTTIDGSFPYVPVSVGLWDDNQIPAMRKFTDIIHAHGTKVIPQISHPGPESLCWLTNGMQPVGPSTGMCFSTKQMYRELAIEEIEPIIEQFGEAARRAQEGGCDGIELHCAHCYMLLGSFISALRNKRTDKYGGSIENRLHLPIEVLTRIRQKVGDDFPIVMRISGEELVTGGRDIHETQYIAPILVEAGVNAFDVSAGAFPHMSWRILPPTGTPLGINIAYSAAIKEVVDVPIMTVGRITDPRFAEDILQRNEADAVILGRSLLADQEWPNKAAEGKFDDIAPCVGCGVGCISGREFGRAMSCVLNPSVGREKKVVITPAGKSKKVMIIGGGPGGLEAARVAALRGHQVTLYEKDSKTGGQLNQAAVPPMKQEITKWVKYLNTQVAKAGVDVNLNTEATPELVNEVKPDAVVVAVGSAPYIPDFPGIENPKVVTAHDILAGKVALPLANSMGKPGIPTANVAILGGGLVGCETADFLASSGDNPIVGRVAVTIVTSKKEIGMDMVPEIRTLLMQRLHEKGVTVMGSSKVKEIIDDGVVIDREGKEETLHGMDSIILARGVKSVDALSDAIKNKVPEVYVIGDAKEPREALEAIAEGNKVGREI
jgi:NAD(H)-dependent 7beta-hydroxy-3-oxo-delta4-cholenoic acid oxidoreductase